MLGQLEDAIAQVEQSNDIRVIILEAAGEKAFCVGADILAWTALSPLGMWSDGCAADTASLIGWSARSNR